MSAKKARPGGGQHQDEPANKGKRIGKLPSRIIDFTTATEAGQDDRGGKQ